MARPLGKRVQLPSWWRAVAVLGLLAIVVLGAAHPHLAFAPSTRTPATASGSAPVGGVPWALVGLGCAVLVVLLVRARRRRRHDDEVPHVSEQPRGRLSRLLAVFVALLVPASVGAAFWWVLRAGPATSGSRTQSGSSFPGFAMSPSHAAASSDVAWYVLLALAGLAAVVVAAVLVGRRRRRAGTGLAAESAPTLSRAVEAGRAALRTVDDDRAAVIACYAAMEEALAEHGVGRTAPETASDHLRRAADSGILELPQVRRLVELFARARFSEHPIGPDDREAARSVLHAFGSRLAVRR